MSTEERVWFYDDHKYQEVYNDGKYQATVSIDEWAEWYDPRTEYDNIGKICIRKHRDYRFPNELDFDFNAYDEDEIKMPEKYYIFRLDCYEHGQIVFSFAGEGMQCRWDTTNHCWFIAVPKKYNAYDLKEISVTPYKKELWEKYEVVELTESEARDIAKQELKEFNQYNNWEIYGYTVYQKVLWASETWEEKYEYETLDSCGWYFSIEDVKSDAEDYINHRKNEDEKF